MYVLGVNSLSHDVSAALVDTDAGRVVAAAEEERFSRVKHHPGIPLGGTGPELSAAWCLREAGIGPADVGLVVEAWRREPLAAFIGRPAHFLARPGMVARALWKRVFRRRPP